MQTQTNLVGIYCRQVGKEIICSQKLRKKLLRELRENVTLYLEQNPEATLEDIHGNFGTPRQIADSYINEMDNTEFLQTISLKKKIIIAVCITLTTCVLIWGVSVGIALRMAKGDSTELNIETYIEEVS